MNKIKTKLRVIRNEENKDEVELYLYGRIGEAIFEDEETITVKDVKDKLKDITANKIIVHLNSGGGCLFSSIAIHNLLKSHKAAIEIVIDSIAASGGSVIAMAGDTIKMYKNSMLMIHPASTYTFGNAKDHEKVAADLKKVDKALKENYKERFTGTDKELEKLIEDETYLTAEEAKELGFCDEIIESNSTVSNNIRNKINKRLINNRQQSKIVADLIKI